MRSTPVHTVLGTVVGETFGYLLTATWTVLIISALGRRLAGRWFSSSLVMGRQP